MPTVTATTGMTYVTSDARVAPSSRDHSVVEDVRDAGTETPSNTIASTMCGSSAMPLEIDVPMASGNDSAVAMTSCPAAATVGSIGVRCLRMYTNAMPYGRAGDDYGERAEQRRVGEVAAAEAGGDAHAGEPEQQPGHLRSGGAGPASTRRRRSR